MKILVVEDDPLVADDLLDNLSKLNYRVTAVAESYDAALKAIDVERPDLALLDIELKGALSGIDLSAALSRLGIPFIYLTSYQDLSTYQHAKHTAPLKNLSKPIDLLNLRNALLDIELPASNQASDNLIHLITDKNGVKQRIDTDQIVYMHAQRSYCDIHFEDGSKITLTSPLTTSMKKLALKDIVQISRFHGVNLKYIRGIRGNEVIMAGNVYLKITDSHKPAFSRYLNTL